MDDTTTVTIAGTEYTVGYLAAGDARKLALKLTRVAGPALKAWFTEIGKQARVEAPARSAVLNIAEGMGEATTAAPESAEAEEQNITAEVMLAAVNELTLNLDEATMESTVGMLAEVTTFKGQEGQTVKLTRSIHTSAFRGDFVGQLLWLGTALQFQYSDFLAGMMVAAKGSAPRGHR